MYFDDDARHMKSTNSMHLVQIYNGSHQNGTKDLHVQMCSHELIQSETIFIRKQNLSIWHDWYKI